MCTLVLLYRVIDGFQIVAMHNRYERSDTLEYPPRRIKGAREIYAPIDVRSGGTWIGANKSGLFVAVTDQHTGIDTDFRRSRGLLMLDLLNMFDDAETAVDYLVKEVTMGYKRGNFVVADKRSAFHVLYEEGHVQKTELEAGVHVITSFVHRKGAVYKAGTAAIRKGSALRGERAMRLAAGIPGASLDDALKRIGVIAADHVSQKGRASICFHGSGDWKMTSSTIIALADDAGRSRLLYTEGNPCTNGFGDYSSLFAKHPTGGELTLKNDWLAGRRVALCMSGSVASVMAPRLARELRRSGCDVECFMTDGAVKFGVSPALMEWATGRGVVTHLTGMSEHLTDYDAILVYPATLNTIRKIALGIADTAVTTLCAANPNDKLIVVPAMNMKLYDNPLLKESLAELRKRGAMVIAPRIDEGIAKIPGIREVSDSVHRKLAVGRLRGRRILLLSGPTRYYLDAVRYISNSSSGALGASIAREAFRRGCEIKVITGPARVPVPMYVGSIAANTVEEMLDATLSELRSGPYDAAIFAAAVLDFEPESKLHTKLKSTGKWNLSLTPTPKIIEMVAREFPKLFIAGFKLEYMMSDKGMIEAGWHRMKELGAGLMVLNDSSQVTEARHRAHILMRDGSSKLVDGTKELLAHEIMDAIEKGL